MALGINEFLHIAHDDQEVSASRTPGSMAYRVNASTGVVEHYRYFQADQISGAAMTAGHAIHFVDAALTKGSSDRSGTDALGILLFLGIAQRTMTQSYYGFAMRKGIASSVVTTSGAAFAIGTTLCIDNTSSGKDGFVTTLAAELDQTSATTLEASLILGFAQHVGIAKTAEATVAGFCDVLVAPLYQLPHYG